MRRLLATVAVAVAVLPSHASAAPFRVETGEWLLERTGRGLTVLDVQVSTSAQLHEPSYVAVLGLQGSRERVRAVDFAVVGGAQGDPLPEAYALGNGVGCGPLGRPPVVCAAHSGHLGWVALYDTETPEHRVSERFVVVARGFEPRVALGKDSRGWRLTRVPAAVREVRAEEADAVGSYVDRGGVEAFHAADAVGGTRGSLAVGNPPCGPGVVTLRGGRTPVESTCLVTSPPASVAGAATEWSLAGPVVGSTDTPYRLVVVDLPLGARPAP